MAELDYDYAVHSAQQREQDKSLLVRFVTMAIPNETKTVKEGRPIYDDTEMIEIRVRGTKDNVVLRPLRPDDKVRFRDQWRDYQDGEQRSNSGTPLAQWPAMGVSMVEEMKHLGFYTVEHLADAKDAVVMSIPGLLSLKLKAKAFLEFAKSSAPLEQMQAKIEEKDNLLATMQNQMVEMQQRMAQLEDEKKTETNAGTPNRAAKRTE